MSRARTRRSAAVAAVFCVATVASPAGAQGNFDSAGWTFTDPLGRPIIVAETDPLTPGQDYFFETYSLTGGAGSPGYPLFFPADTVVSIRADATDVAAGSLAGADSCGSDLTASCFDWIAPRMGTRTYFVWVRALNLFSSGGTRVHYCAVNSHGDCTEPWHELIADPAGATFGGVTVQGLGTDAPTIQLETSELPGGGDRDHIIALGMDNRVRETNWIIGGGGAATGEVGSGTLRSHRSFVGGTAQYTGHYAFATPMNGFALFAPLPTNAPGPLMVMRNDCIYQGPTFGCGRVDADQDSLGDALEQALGSCDRPTDPAPFPGVPSCAARYGCAAGLCNQAVPPSDTDGDGFRDDLELYGTSEVLGGALPRYGASPTHYDVFVDYNYLDAVRSDAPGSCDPPSTMTPAQALGAGAIYLGDGASTLRNRDGTTGVHLHTAIYNVPVPAFGGNMSAGNWRGRDQVHCQLDPACTTDRDCPGVGADCCVAGEADCDFHGFCQRYDHAGYLTGSARWIWRTAYDRGLDLRGHSNFGTVFVSSGPSTYVHELGHNANLYHGGPLDARLSVERGNGSPVAQSRMNYAFVNLPIDVRTMTFSNGRLPTLHARAVAERGPFDLAASADSGRAYAAMLRFFPTDGFVHVLSPPGMTCIDWNRDGLCSAGTVEAGVQDIYPHIERFSIRSRLHPSDLNQPDQVFLAETGDQLVVSGEFLMRLRIEGVRSGGAIVPRILTNTTNTLSCSDAPAPSGLRYPDCGFDNPTGDDTMADIAVRPQAVAAAEIIPGQPCAADSDCTRGPFGGGSCDQSVGVCVGFTRHIVVVWVEDSSTLLWAVLGPTSAGRLLLEGYGLVPGTDPLASISALDGIPSLARIGRTSFVSLLYRNAMGGISEQVGVFDVAASTMGWGNASTVLSPASGRTFVGSVGATHVSTTTPLLPAGAVLAIDTDTIGASYLNSTSRLEIYSRGSSGGWRRVSQLDTSYLRIIGRPTLATRPYDVGGVSRSRLVATFRPALGSTAEMIYAETDLDHITNWIPPLEFHRINTVPNGIRSVSGAALAYDDRASVAAPRGLRATYTQIVECATLGSHGCAGPGTTCAALDADQPLTNASSFRNACIADGTRLVQALDFTVPGADGVVPMGYESYDEWNTMQDNFCTTIRIAMGGDAGNPASSPPFAPPRYQALWQLCPSHPPPPLR